MYFFAQGCVFLQVYKEFIEDEEVFDFDPSCCDSRAECDGFLASSIGTAA
jgi:hypothetical protein